MTTVRVGEHVVGISEQGHVRWRSTVIGRVYKGTRTYSPPTHKGSRIAKYHKQVPCWYATADPTSLIGRGHQEDTRRKAILWLIRKAEERTA